MKALFVFILLLLCSIALAQSQLGGQNDNHAGSQQMNPRIEFNWQGRIAVGSNAPSPGLVQNPEKQLVIQPLSLTGITEESKIMRLPEVGLRPPSLPRVESGQFPLSFSLQSSALSLPKLSVKSLSLVPISPRLDLFSSPREERMNVSPR